MWKSRTQEWERLFFIFFKKFFAYRKIFVYLEQIKQQHIHIYIYIRS